MYYFRYSYLVFGVASYYVTLRRMKQHSHQIISSVMQGMIHILLMKNYYLNMIFQWWIISLISFLSLVHGDGKQNQIGLHNILKH